MIKKELNYIKEMIECKGFDYIFIHGSDFLEIKDEKFHKLREEYIKADRELKKYLGI